MKVFLVRWEINVEAASPKEAAERALEIQRDSNSIATVFDVTDCAVPLLKRSTVRVDLLTGAVTPLPGNTP